MCLSGGSEILRRGEDFEGRFAHDEHVSGGFWGAAAGDIPVLVQPFNHRGLSPVIGDSPDFLLLLIFFGQCSQLCVELLYTLLVCLCTASVAGYDCVVVGVHEVAEDVMETV